LARTKATVDQTTGAVVAASSTKTAIIGNFEADPLSDEDRTPGGLVQEGDSVLYTEAALAIGDGVEVHHDDSGSFSRWRVKGLERRYDWLHAAEGSTDRPAYVLAREEVT
jgi:hypothetical protein